MPGDDDIYRGQVTQRTPLNVALCAIWYRLWQITGFGSSGSGGVPYVPPTVNGVKVVGIQEVDSSAAFTSPTGHGVAAGGLAWAFYPSSDFVGTLAYGIGTAITWTGAMGPASRDAQPGNTLPGATITCSAGSYVVVEGRPS